MGTATRHGWEHLVDSAVVDEDAVGDVGGLCALRGALLPEAAQQAGVVPVPVHLHRHHELRGRVQRLGAQQGRRNQRAAEVSTGDTFPAYAIMMHYASHSNVD